MTEPWLNEDGSTNVDGFLAAYADDDNTFWCVETGHIMNVLDELIERLDGRRPSLSNAPGDWRWEQRGELWWRIHDELNIEDGPYQRRWDEP